MQSLLPSQLQLMKLLHQPLCVLERLRLAESVPWTTGNRISDDLYPNISALHLTTA